ncbi:MAG: hypothetical protein PHC97_02980 [Patescibacteria group bacterium]|nr:hypothetical protein [Patescibacteria group bacterium]
MAEKNENTRGDFGEIFFQWHTPEFTRYPRGWSWYLLTIVIGLVLIIYSIFTANFLFALIIILAGFIVFLKSYKQPVDLLFQITESGLVLGNQFFDYDRIKNFYFIYDPPVVKKLFFNLKGLAPTVSIQLNDKNPLLVRERLLKYLKEDVDKKHQALDDQLESILKL